MWSPGAVLREESRQLEAAARHSGACMPYSSAYGRFYFGPGGRYRSMWSRAGGSVLRRSRPPAGLSRLRRSSGWRARRARQSAGVKALRGGGFAGAGYTSERSVLPARRDVPIFAPPMPIRVERKLIQGSTNQTAVTDLEVVDHLNVISMGDAVYQRDGSRVKMLGLQLVFDVYPSTKASAFNPGTPIGRADLIRFYLIYDRRPTGAVPTYSSIFLNGFLRVDARDRFELIQKWEITARQQIIFGNASNYFDSSVPGAISHKHYQLPLAHPAAWQQLNTDGALGGMISGALYLMYICSSVPVADLATAPTVGLIWQTQYVDA